MPKHFTQNDFLLSETAVLPGNEVLELQAEAPSNIALVKYWGKKSGGVQLPMNASLSFTLSRSKTQTRARLTPLEKPAGQVSFDVRLDSRPRPDFAPKMARFFERIAPYAPYIRFYRWEIDSHNSFPHGSGIASSASGFAAMARLVMQLGEQLGLACNGDFCVAKTSFLARLGSGSAARSVAEPVMLWGRDDNFPESSDLYAVRPAFDLHPSFDDVRDTIVLIDRGVKPVSSTRGHELIHQHPFRKARLETARKNLLALAGALQTGDWEAFGRVLEAEALMLHALMATSNPPYILIQPETLRLIRDLQDWRNRTGRPVYFTLDAGANVHLLYPAAEHQAVLDLLKNTLPELYAAKQYIPDKVKSGID